LSDSNKVITYNGTPPASTVQIRPSGSTHRHTYIAESCGTFGESREYDMTNSKLQAALDEIERLCDTVKGFKERNGGTLPNPDSNAGRALSTLEMFTSELHKMDIGKILGHKI
jgi:hypothetical protein